MTCVLGVFSGWENNKVAKHDGCRSELEHPKIAIKIRFFFFCQGRELSGLNDLGIKIILVAVKLK